MSKANTKPVEQAEPVERQSFADMARAALEASDGNRQAAAEIMATTILSDPAIATEFLPVIVKAWCSDHVGAQIAQNRKNAWTPPIGTDGQGVRLLNAITYLSLLDFPLPGGKRLGDASSGEVRNAAAEYKRVSDDMGWKARWLERVADRIGSKRVADVLSDEDLRRMQSDVQ